MLEMYIILVFANFVFVSFSESIKKNRRSVSLSKKDKFIDKIVEKIFNNSDDFITLTEILSLGIIFWGGIWFISVTINVILRYFNHLQSSFLAILTFLFLIFSLVIFYFLSFVISRYFSSVFSNQILKIFSIPMYFIYIITYPLFFLIYYTNRWFLSKIENKSTNKQITDEIRSLIEERTIQNSENREEQKLLANVIDFSDTPAKQIMVPRTNISAIDIDSSIEEIIHKVIEEGYSRLPVYKDNIDNIIGEIYSKDILNLLVNKNLITLSDILRSPFFVSEDDKISDILKIMQKQHQHLAIVLNEFGGVAGLLTIEDIIEELVGEIQDEYDEEKPLVTETSVNQFEVEATISIADINEVLPEKLPESDAYNTIGGYITHNIGRVPNSNEYFKIGNYKFLIKQSTERKIISLNIIYEPEPIKDIEND